MERWKTLLAERIPSEKVGLFAQGYRTVAYQIKGVTRPPDLPDLYRLLGEIQRNMTGWPVWCIIDREPIRPHAIEGCVEAWMAEPPYDDVEHADYWRVMPGGFAFLLRHHEEDAWGDRAKPGMTLDLMQPIWRTGEALLHAERLAAALGVPNSAVSVRCSWDGLRGRTLERISTIPRLPWRGGQSQQGTVVALLEVADASQISTLLPELVITLTKPLYEVFDFFKVPRDVVTDELARMRSSRF